MKVLEYFPVNKIKPIGGPAGYLFNLISAFSSPDIEIETLPPEKEVSGKLKKLPRRVKRFLNNFFFNRLVRRFAKGKGQIANIDSYDAIHFHTTYELALHAEQLANYKGKIIVTSHSPCPMHLEIYNEQLDWFGRLVFGRKIKKRAAFCDEKAFDMATHILFPCPEAEEPYYHLWDKYKDIHARNSSKYVYLLSGSTQRTAQISRADIRNNLGIAEEEFVVAYAGRHNSIKGYDSLKEIASLFLKDTKGHFVICGKPGPIPPLKNQAWKEIGWTNKADSFISAADCFVLPNRETYFDLIMLEVLSLGQVVVASKTGGNKAFEKMQPNGIFLYETAEEATAILKKLSEMPKESRKELGQKNKELFDKEFSAERFAKRYEKTYKDILEGKI